MIGQCHQSGRGDQGVDFLNRAEGDLPVTLMRQGEVHSATGNPEAEAAVYSQLLALWSDPDDELRPWMQRVVDRVELLRAGLPAPDTEEGANPGSPR